MEDLALHVSIKIVMIAFPHWKHAHNVNLVII